MVRRRVHGVASLVAVCILFASDGCSSSHAARASEAPGAGAPFDAGSSPTHVVRDDLPCAVDLAPGVTESDACPATSPDPFGECVLPAGVACLYGASHGGGLPVVVAASCDARAGSTWSLDTGACARSCSPPDGGDFIEFDVSDCAARELAACADGLTEQARLDATLANLLQLGEFDRYELREARLYLELVDGCPRRVYHSWGRPLSSAGKLVDSLSFLRLSCALDLTCAEFEGPSTLD